jgi:peptidoglycan-associated lipoprotein
MTRRSKRQLVLLGILAVLLASGCKKKPAPVAAAAPPPPPPPAPTKPTATVSANPTSIERGQSTTLEWRTTDATSIRIEPEIGSVPATGSRSIRPSQSTTYRIVAEGPGGSADGSTRVTVTNPPPPPPPPPPPTPDDTVDKYWLKFVKPILFDYDKYTIRDDQKAAFDGNVAFFKKYPDAKIVIQGNCDERGSGEYNLGLGDKRANTVKEALIAAGIAADRISTISFGKEKPVCSESTEDCWQKNRRDEFVHK